MTGRAEIDLLLDILVAIDDIEQFTEGINYATFANNREKMFAVIKAIEMIGEAVKGLSESFKTEHSQIPWKGFAGMRDKLVHQYWGIDLAVVWETVQIDIPFLKTTILIVLQ